MITEDYVSLECAKLLKEKGFDGDCRVFYKDSQAGLYEFKNVSKSYKDKLFEPCFLAPTLQMAMKWLREVRNIIISIHPNDFKSNGTTCYKADIWIKDKYVYEYEYNKEGNYDYTDREKETFEESCEDAVEYCLINLI